MEWIEYDFTAWKINIQLVTDTDRYVGDHMIFVVVRRHF